MSALTSRGGRTTAAVVVLLGLWPAAASADNSTPAPARLPVVTGPLRLTPDSAAKLAVQRSTDAALAEQTVALAESQLLLARAMMGWQVQASGNLTQSGPPVSFQLPNGNGGSPDDPPGQPGDTSGESITISPTTRFGVNLQLTKPLYLGGRNRHAKDAANFGIDAAGAGRSATDIQVALSARRAVFSLLRLMQLSVVAQENLTSVNEHLRVAEVMLREGTAPRFEVVQAQTVVSRATGAYIRAHSAAEQQTAALKRLMNLSQNVELTVEEGVPPQAPEGDLSGLVALAYGQRPDVQALEAVVRAAESSLRLAFANDRVTVSLSGLAAFQTAGALSGAESWQATVEVTKPLYQGGATEAGIKQAEAELASARLDLEDAQQQVSLQVAQSLLAVTEAREQLRVAQDGVVEARERLRIAEVRFQNGVGLGIEVIDGQQALAVAQVEVVNATHDLNLAITNLRASLGLLDLPKE